MTNRARVRGEGPRGGGPSERLGRRFYATDSPTLAQKLLGQRLVRVLEDGTRLAGIIVETEAYTGAEDAAAHSFGGRRTARNEVMYGRAGLAYVYFTYGMHFCFNVVCGREGEAVAVLIRALEPTEGLGRMRVLRAADPPGVRMGRPARAGWKPRDPAAIPETLLCSGPARLCQALAIDRGLNGADLTADSRLWIERARAGRLDAARVGNSARIGVDYAGPWAQEPLRWFIAGNVHVSGRKMNQPVKKKLGR